MSELPGEPRLSRAPEVYTNTRAEIDAVTLRAFDWLTPIVLVLGTLTLGVAIWRTLEFSEPGLILVYVGFFLVLVGVLLFRRRVPLAVVSATICLVGLVDGFVTLWIYGFASAGVLLLFVSTLCAGIFFGLRGAWVTLALSLAAIGTAGWGAVTGSLALKVDIESYLRSPAGWMIQIVHFALLAALLIAMLHAVQTRLTGTLSTLQRFTARLVEMNRSLKTEAEARRSIEEELRASAEQYRLVTAHMRDVVAFQDLELRLRYVSPSIERMLGYTEEEALGLSMVQLMSGESLTRALRHLGWSGGGGPDSSSMLAEYEYLHKDGSKIWGELSATRVWDEQGRPRGAVVVIRDVTDRHRTMAEKERLKEQLERSERLRILGQLAGGIAHDFNNQLAGITGYAELAYRRRSDPEFVAEAARVILQCARRAADLTGRLLSFARRTPAQVCPVDVHEMIREVLVILERSIDKGIRLRLELDAERPTVIGDVTVLLTALLNLCLNARDAMPDGGELCIATRLIEPERARRAGAGRAMAAIAYLALEVRDDGHGMSPDTQRQIFEPFFTTKTGQGGTGLGLSAVQAAVDAHDGAIEVESVEGEGTTFRLFLPLASAAVSSGVKEVKTLAPCTGKILVVDDEPVLRRVIDTYLRQHGYEVVTAGDGRGALVEFRKGDFALVLLDLVLPQLDGASVFVELRQLAPRVPVILMSGHDEEQVAGELVRRGAAELLRKPFGLDELLDRISENLRASRVQSIGPNLAGSGQPRDPQMPS